MTDDLMQRAASVTARWLTFTGLQLPETISQEDEELVLLQVRSLGGAMQWARGDIGLYARGRAYRPGLTYQQAIVEWAMAKRALANRLGVEVHTLENEIALAHTYAHSERFAGKHVTWAHHRAISTLPPSQRSELLQLAEENEWTVVDLIAHIRGPGKLPPAGSRFQVRDEWQWGPVTMRRTSPSEAQIDTGAGAVTVRAVGSVLEISEL